MGGSGSNPDPDKDRPSTSSSLPEERAGTPSHILIVEDNAADVFLIRAAMNAAGIEALLHVVKDGEQAIQFFDAADADPSAPCPAVVLLDINLPKKQGGEVLEYMRKSRRCSRASVIVVSTSTALRDREEMTRLGADAYFGKSSEYGEFMKLGGMVKELLGKRPQT